jgi:hypothetical protein
MDGQAWCSTCCCSNGWLLACEAAGVCWWGPSREGRPRHLQQEGCKWHGQGFLLCKRHVCPHLPAVYACAYTAWQALHDPAWGVCRQGGGATPVYLCSRAYLPPNRHQHAPGVSLAVVCGWCECCAVRSLVCAVLWCECCRCCCSCSTPPAPAGCVSHINGYWLGWRALAPRCRACVTFLVSLEEGVQQAAQAVA